MFNNFHNKPYKIIFNDDTHKLVYARSEADALRQCNKDKEFISVIVKLNDQIGKDAKGLVIEMDRSNMESLDKVSLDGFIVTKYDKDCFDPYSDDNKRENSYTKLGRKLKNGGSNEQSKNNN